MRGPQSSIRATLNQNAESMIEWNPCEPGKYFLRIVYKADALPQDVLDNFFNQQHPSHAIWDAALTLSTKEGIIYFTNSLNMEIVGKVENDVYFVVGWVDLKEPADLKIRLTPREPAPFGASPSIAVGPSGLYYENYVIGRLLWHIATLACIPISIFLLLDLMRRKQTRKDNP